MANRLFEDLINAAQPRLVLIEDEPIALGDEVLVHQQRDYPVITYEQNPGETLKWRLPELRKKALNDKSNTWNIGFDGTDGTMVVWRGYVGGKITFEKRDIILNKSGKNMFAQGLQDIRQLYIEKVREGYIPPFSGELPMITLMSGKAYETTMKLKYPVLDDTKYDGMRMWVRGTGDGTFVEGLSRGNKPFLHVGHILKECKSIMAYLPPGSAIDGEMWSPKFDFQKITSIGRKVLEEDPDMVNMEYHVFDVYWIDNPPYEVRRNVLAHAMAAYYSERFKTEFPVDFYGQGDYKHLRGYTNIFLSKSNIAYSFQDIEAHYKQYLAEGYEGLIIRKLANGAPPGTPQYKESQYLMGKGTHFLKLKPDVDEEALVVGIQDSKGKEKGCAKLVVRDIRGNVFPIRMGNYEERRIWMAYPYSIIGKAVTIRYQNLTNAGVPRFPRGIVVRDYEPGYDVIAANDQDLNTGLVKAREELLAGPFRPPGLPGFPTPSVVIIEE